MINYEDILKLKAGLDNAETDEPILFVDKDEIKVQGDANNTRVHKHDYKLIFETEDGRFTKEYKDVHILPRKRTGIVRLLTMLLPYFTKVDEDGNVISMSDEELGRTLLGVEDAVFDLMYDLAEKVLDVPTELKDYIDPVSVLAFSIKLIIDNPAVVKEAEMSFG